jgi:alanine racemase
MKILRPSWAEVSLENIAGNFNALKDFVGPKTDILAVVKADAYGHGVRRVACTLEKLRVRFFGVATVEEGIELRQAGITKDVLILGSIYPFDNFREVVHYGLTPTVASVSGIEALEKCAAAAGKRVPFHLKVDTGMGRIGLNPSTALSVYRRMKTFKNIYMEGIYTHLAAGEARTEFTDMQFAKFKSLCDKVNVKFRHIAASASILKYKNKNKYFNLVRPGLLIYGLLPFSGSDKIVPTLPALSLKTRIVFIKRVPRNTSISYGRTFITRKESRIATVPLGYADGMLRYNSNNATVLVKGRRAPVVGRVCMDMTMIDVTGIKGVSVGDEVVIIGSQGRERVTAKMLPGAAEP